MGSDRDDEDREAILRRRQRLIAIALAGASSIATGCSDAGPTPCLEPAIDSGREDAGPDAAPAACLRPDTGPRVAGTDAGPTPCLTGPPPDAGREPDAGEVDSGMVTPMPCLTMAPPDSGPSKG